MSQDMLGTTKLRDLSDQHCAARTHELVGRAAETGIRGDTRERIRRAAFDAEHEFANRTRFPSCLIHCRQHGFDCFQAVLDRRLCSADVLHTESHEWLIDLALTTAKVLLDDRKIRFLTTQLDENDTADVGMIRVVREHTEQDLNIRTIRSPAPLVMRNCDDAVDVRIFVALTQRELGNGRDLLRLVARTHAGRHNQNVIARADSSIRTAKTHECGRFSCGNVNRRIVTQIVWKIAADGNFVGHINVRHSIALTDAERRPDRLAILHDEVSGRNRRRSEAIPGRYAAGHSDSSAIGQFNMRLRRDRTLRDRDVIGRIHNNRVITD
jgi:hypothetical protein